MAGRHRKPPEHEFLRWLIARIVIAAIAVTLAYIAYRAFWSLYD